MTPIALQIEIVMKPVTLKIILITAFFTTMVSPAAAQVWQWVDRDGVLTFSNTNPPANARDASLIVTAANDDPTPSRLTRDLNGPESRHASPAVNHQYADSAGAARHAAAPWPGDDVILIADMGAEAPRAAWSYDCCLRYVKPYPSYNAYAPFTDYAYTRSYRHRPYRRGGRGFRQPSYRQNLSYYRRQYHFGARQYERDYFSSSYRYHSRVPRYHRFSRPPIDGRSYGLNRYDGRSISRIYRGGRTHRGGRVGAGSMRGYRGGSGFGSRR